MSLFKISVSTALMSSVTAIRILAQIAILPFLARILSPDDYGLIGMVMPIILFSMMFSDIGIGASLVRTNYAQDRREWSASFWLLLGLGAGVMLLVSLLAPLIGGVLSEPRIIPLIIVLSVVIFVQSAATVPGAYLQYSKKFKTLAAVDMASMVLSLGAVIGAALWGYGVWALVLQQLVHYFTRLVLIVPLSGFFPSFNFNLASVRRHVEFGKNLLGASVVTTALQSITALVIGKFLGVEAVGMYTMALLFVNLPFRLVALPLQFVLYPYLCQINEHPDRLKLLFLFSTRCLAIAFLPVVLLAGAAHEPLFRIFLSEKWYMAGYIFMILSPVAAFQTLSAVRGVLVTAQGRTDVLFRQSIEYAAIFLAFLFVGVSFGLTAVAASGVFAFFLYHIRAINMSLSLVGVRLKEYAEVISSPALITVLAVCAFVILDKSMPNLIQLFCLAMLCVFSVFLSLVLQLPTIKQEFKAIKNIFDR